MSREASITQEQINAAADAIRASGAKPTTRAVRESLGTGSAATIIRLLRVWQSGQIKPATEAVTLPSTLQRALVDFIGQEVATARAGLEADLAEAQAAQAELINESDRQASTIELQAEALESSQAAQAAAEAHSREAMRLGEALAEARQAAQVQALEIDKAKEAAEAARSAAAEARIEAEAAQLRGRLETIEAHQEAATV